MRTFIIVTNDFIGEYYLNDNKICDDLIKYFESSNRKQPGVMGYETVDKNLKDSTDLSVNTYEVNRKEHSVVLEYYNQVLEVLDQYVNDYPECNNYGAFGVKEPFIFKRYKPGQGYKCWHCERASAQPVASDRHLVFMTYLNDVTDAGQTEFKIQKRKVDARKGKTLIWPVDWTHTHRGIVSPTQLKYIVGGWFSYLDTP